MESYLRIGVSTARSEYDLARVIIGVPGLFGGPRFFEPITPTVIEFGDFKPISFIGAFDGNGIASELSQLIDDGLRHNNEVIILAVSTGGLIALEAINNLRLNDKDKRRVRFVAIDAPAHIADLRKLRYLEDNDSIILPALLDGAFELPKPGRDDHSHYLGRVYASSGQLVDAARQFIKATHRTPSDQFADHIGYLECPIARRPWPAVEGVRGCYVACKEEEYLTLNQPAALTEWRRRTGWPVQPAWGPSAGWAARPRYWAEQIKGILEMLTQ